MKRILIILLIISAFSFLSFQSVKNRAVVKFLIGKVEYQPFQMSGYRPLSLNHRLGQGDRIKTTLNSRVELTMPDGSVIKINENTIFDIKELKDPETDNEDKMSFTLWAGNMWASFKKIVSTRQTRTVESPSAVVAVRGTTLEMDVDLQQKTQIRVYEGTVSVTSKDVAGEVVVSTNQQTSVEPGQAPQDPTEFTPDESGDDEPGEIESEAFAFNISLNQFVFTDPAVLAAGIPLNGSVPIGTVLSVDGVPIPVSSQGQFSTSLRISEGLNTVELSALFQGKTYTRTLRIFVNTSKPELSLTTPVVAGFINRRDYSLSGGVFDPTPQDKVKVFINDEEVLETDGTGSFNRTIILEEGQNNIVVRAQDRSQNTTESIQSIFLDTVKPILTITDPPVPNYVRYEPPAPPTLDITQFEQIIRGIIIDPEPTSGIKSLSVNGKEIQPNSDGTFETVIFIERGITQLNFIIEDLSGNILRDNSRSIRVPR